MVKHIEESFSKLRHSEYRVTSPEDKRYNCIAWAAGDAGNWWWPRENPDEAHWPSGVALAETLEAFIAAFASLGYGICPNSDLEPGFEKVALFVDDAKIPTHAARQLASGLWTSKLGKTEDIEHHLADLEGEQYGSVIQIMKRAIPDKREKR